MESNYYAIIPANVRYDPRLKANEKLMYGEITALSNQTGYCYATNKYFADLYNVSSTSVSLWVRNLIDCGYLKSEIKYVKGTMQVEARYLRILIYPPQENLNTPPQENLKDNNTSINNTSIKNINVNWENLIKQFNDITGKSTRVINPKVRSQILARLKEGYTKEDLVTAIVNCYNDEYHIKNNHIYLTLEFISRAGKLDQFLNRKK